MSASIKITGFDGAIQFLRKLEGVVEKAVDRSIYESVHSTASDMRNNIKDGDFTPNAPYTVALKGRDEPLVDTGDMLSSIKAIKTKKGWSAGPTGHNRSAGMSNLKLATRNEAGGWEVKENGHIVKVPARPFAQKPVDENIDELPRLIEKKIEAFL